MTFRFSAYNNYYCHDTGSSFQLIFMKCTWLVRVNTWVNPIIFLFFFNNRFNEHWYGRKCALKTGLLAFIQPVWIFWRKNFKAVSRTLFSIKRFYSFLSSDTPIPWKMVMSAKIFFSRLFWKMLFLLRKMYEKYSILHFLQKIYIDFCGQTTPSCQNGHVIPQMVFHNFFNVNWKTSERISCSKVYSVEIKFYGE